MKDIKKMYLLLLVFLISLVLPKIILANEKQFHTVAVNYPPFIQENSSDYGMSWNLFKAALETQGYDVSIEFAPWARAYSDTKNGKYDCLLVGYKTKERSELFAYPDYPIAYVTTGFLKKKNRTDINYTGNLRDLSSFDIGVENLASMGKEFDQADYLNKIFVKESKQLLKMIYVGNIDIGVVGFEYSIINLNEIKKLPRFKGIADNIEFMYPALDKRPAYSMISKQIPNYDQKLYDLNEGLKKIRKNGIFKKILNRYGISDNNYF